MYTKRISARKSFDKPMEQVYIDIPAFTSWLSINGVDIKCLESESNGKKTYSLVDSAGNPWLKQLTPYSSFPSVNVKELTNIIDAQVLMCEPRLVRHTGKDVDISVLMKTYISFCYRCHKPVSIFSELVRVGSKLPAKLTVKSTTEGVGPKGGNTTTLELVVGTKDLGRIVCFGHTSNAVAPGYRLVETFLNCPNKDIAASILKLSYGLTIGC